MTAASLLLAAILGLAPAAAAASLRAVVSGRDAGAVDAYRVGSDYYLEASRAGSLYGGRVYWYPVSGRVQMSVKGRQIRFFADSDLARTDSGTLKLSRPVLVRASRAYVPLDFFMSPEFSRLSGLQTRFDRAQGLLTIERKGAARKPSAPAAKAEAPPSSSKPPPPPAPKAAPAPPPGLERVAENAVDAGSRKRARIVIDAGHGGKDSGATVRHRKVKEKDINLLVARELADALRKKDAFDVMLIRSDDTFVPLQERSRRADDFGADLFISLHCNATRRRPENGFEIYFLSERASDPEAMRVAEAENAVLKLEGKDPKEELEAADVLHAMARTEFINDASELAGLMTGEIARKSGLANRGVKQAAFYVLRGTNAPAVLVEMGFLTNSKDEARLRSKSFRHKLVGGLLAGVLDYGRRHHWSMGPDR